MWCRMSCAALHDDGTISASISNSCEWFAPDINLFLEKQGRFFSQLLNNLQTLPVYSLKLRSRQTMRVRGGLRCQMRGERRRRIGYLVRLLWWQGEDTERGNVKYMRRKRRRTENTSVSRERDGGGKKNLFLLMSWLKDLWELKGEGAWLFPQPLFLLFSLNRGCVDRLRGFG